MGLINSLLFHNNSFYVSNLCAKLYRKPLRNHRKRSNIVLYFSRECPMLFLVHINDIGDKLLSLSRLFADDTSLGYASQDDL
jgi:hypothetical protein